MGNSSNEWSAFTIDDTGLAHHPSPRPAVGTRGRGHNPRSKKTTNKSKKGGVSVAFKVTSDGQAGDGTQENQRQHQLQGLFPIGARVCLEQHNVNECTRHCKDLFILLNLTRVDSGGIPRSCLSDSKQLTLRQNRVRRTTVPNNSHFGSEYNVDCARATVTPYYNKLLLPVLGALYQLPLFLEPPENAFKLKHGSCHTGKRPEKNYIVGFLLGEGNQCLQDVSNHGSDCSMSLSGWWPVLRLPCWSRMSPIRRGRKRRREAGATTRVQWRK